MGYEVVSGCSVKQIGNGWRIFVHSTANNVRPYEWRKWLCCEIFTRRKEAEATLVKIFSDGTFQGGGSRYENAALVLNTIARRVCPDVDKLFAKNREENKENDSLKKEERKILPFFWSLADCASHHSGFENTAHWIEKHLDEIFSEVAKRQAEKFWAVRRNSVAVTRPRRNSNGYFSDFRVTDKSNIPEYYKPAIFNGIDVVKFYWLKDQGWEFITAKA